MVRPGSARLHFCLDRSGRLNQRQQLLRRKKSGWRRQWKQNCKSLFFPKCNWFLLSEVYAGKIRIFFQWKCVLRLRRMYIYMWCGRSGQENVPCRNPAAFLGFTFLVFSQAIRVLRWKVIVNLHVMGPTAPWLVIFFQGKRASQEGLLGVVTAIASFHSYPSQEESQILTKEHCTGMYRRCWVIWL